MFEKKNAILGTHFIGCARLQVNLINVKDVYISIK